MDTEWVCPDCGKVLATKKARAGHMWIVHRTRPGWKFELESKVAALEAELSVASAKLEELGAGMKHAKDVALMSEVALSFAESTGTKCPKCHQAYYLHDFPDVAVKTMRDEKGRPRAGVVILCPVAS